VCYIIDVFLRHGVLHLALKSNKMLSVCWDSATYRDYCRRNAELHIISYPTTGLPR